MTLEDWANVGGILGGVAAVAGVAGAFLIYLYKSAKSWWTPERVILRRHFVITDDDVVTTVSKMLFVNATLKSIFLQQLTLTPAPGTNAGLKVIDLDHLVEPFQKLDLMDNGAITSLQWGSTYRPDRYELTYISDGNRWMTGGLWSGEVTQEARSWWPRVILNARRAAQWPSRNTRR